MVNAKEIIEKIWWVIPPIVIVFGMPLVYTFKEMVEFSQPMALFIWCYSKNFSVYIRNFTVLGGIVAILTFGFHTYSNNHSAFRLFCFTYNSIINNRGGMNFDIIQNKRLDICGK